MRTPQETLPQSAALTVALPTATAEVKPRTVKVVVLPADATVEVDGVSVTPNDGAVEIKGAIGSVHKVHVTSPDGDVLRDVALTEDGAIPPKVAVEAKPAKLPGVAGQPGLPSGTRGPLPTAPRGAATTSPLPLRNQR